MNISIFLGFILAGVVFFGTVFTSSGNARVFLDMHALTIVVGGTLAASMVSFSVARMIELFKIFLRRVIGDQNQMLEVMTKIVDLSRGYREDDAYLNKAIPQIKHPFLREAVSLLAEGGLTAEELDEILAKRVRTIYQRYEEDAENFKALSKFPPAFGLLGAVIGIISLMQNLGGQDAFQKVGPAMAIALVATLYGIAIANFVFLPLGEHLSRINKRDYVMRAMICDGIKNIRAKKHPLMVEESCKSYQLPSERSALKKAA